MFINLIIILSVFLIAHKPKESFNEKETIREQERTLKIWLLK